MEKTLFVSGLFFTAAALSPAQNIEKFVVSPEAAKKTLIRNEVNADTAEKITQACVNFAKQHNIAVSVFVVNPTGQIMVSGNLALQMRWGNIGVFPTSGGLPIMADGQMIGAIGVGGSNMDEQCADEALTSVVGPQPPLAPNQPPQK